MISGLRRCVVGLFCRASGLFVLAHTGSGWSRYEYSESCGGALCTRQFGRWPPSPCFWPSGNKPEASKPSTAKDLPLSTIRLSALHVFLSGCVRSVTACVLFFVLFTYAFVHLYTFQCVFLVFTAHLSVQICLSFYAALFDTLLFTGHRRCFFNNILRVIRSYNEPIL
jgi:hypothetical protein